MKEKVNDLVKKLLSACSKHDFSSAFTVGISGIDASGKGFITQLIQQELESAGYNIANINIDPWQNSRPIRLQNESKAENFYSGAFQWAALFEQLLIPLQKNKSIYLETKGIRTDKDVYYPIVYEYANIDILLIEGIFLFKKEFLSYYDYRIWIDCPFEKGLQRALQRNAEGLDEKNLVHDYGFFYYAAQRLHFEKDNPGGGANIIFVND